MSNNGNERASNRDDAVEALLAGIATSKYVTAPDDHTQLNAERLNTGDGAAQALEAPDTDAAFTWLAEHFAADLQQHSAISQ